MSHKIHPGIVVFGCLSCGYFFTTLAAFIGVFLFDVLTSNQALYMSLILSPLTVFFLYFLMVKDKISQFF